MCKIYTKKARVAGEILSEEVLIEEKMLNEIKSLQRGRMYKKNISKEKGKLPIIGQTCLKDNKELTKLQTVQLDISKFIEE